MRYVMFFQLYGFYVSVMRYGLSVMSYVFLIMFYGFYDLCGSYILGNALRDCDKGYAFRVWCYVIWGM